MRCGPTRYQEQTMRCGPIRYQEQTMRCGPIRYQKQTMRCGPLEAGSRVHYSLVAILEMPAFCFRL